MNYHHGQKQSLTLSFRITQYDYILGLMGENVVSAIINDTRYNSSSIYIQFGKSYFHTVSIYTVIGAGSTITDFDRYRFAWSIEIGVKWKYFVLGLNQTVNNRYVSIGVYLNLND